MARGEGKTLQMCSFNGKSYADFNGGFSRSTGAEKAEVSALSTPPKANTAREFGEGGTGQTREQEQAVCAPKGFDTLRKILLIHWPAGRSLRE